MLGPEPGLLVKRFEERGWVQRRRQADDGRVVLVSITEAGSAALEDLRGRYRVVLRAVLAGMSDEQVAALENATEAFHALARALQRGGSR